MTRPAHACEEPSTDGSGRTCAPWCLDTKANSDDQTLTLLLCRAQDSPPGRLRWPTSQQVRFSIMDSKGSTVWTYDPQVRPEPATDDVPAGRCVGWQILWRADDEQGRRLARGSYTLLASTTADGLDTTQVNHSFTIN